MTAPQSPPPNGSRATPWTSGTKSGAVQHAFVNARIADINRHAISKLFTPTLDALKAADPSLRKASRKQLEDAFMHMQQRLQTAPLTINFISTKWFITPNNYDSYTQMYERAVSGGQMKLTDSPLNPAAIRVAADDRATFPKSAVDADFEVTGMGGRWKKYDLKATASPAVGRGLAPGGRALGDAVVKMAPGALNKTAGGEYAASNPQFDPRTKQVFAARAALELPPRRTTRRHRGKNLLLEAHLFEAVRFTGGATEMHVSGKDQLTQAGGSKRPVTGAEWQTIQSNARAFARKHGLRIFFVE